LTSFGNNEYETRGVRVPVFHSQATTQMTTIAEDICPFTVKNLKNWK